MKPASVFLLALLLAPLSVLQSIDYPYVTSEPQKSGRPLTAEERAYVVEKPKHDRRPGREANKHLPQLWPVVPSAGHFGGDAWLKLHEAHVKTVQANQGHIDELLVGDSITLQWGDAWKKHFPDSNAVNIGIGGDQTQNVLWRLPGQRQAWAGEALLLLRRKAPAAGACNTRSCWIDGLSDRWQRRHALSRVVEYRLQRAIEGSQWFLRRGPTGDRTNREDLATHRHRSAEV